MFNEFLTIEGERLLAKSIAGTATITFTKMEIGDGDRGVSSRNITSLESKRMTLDIYSVQLSGDNHITITSNLKSENIEEGFYFREKAVYATDGNSEILFMYGTAGSLAEWVENSKSSVFERTIRTIISLSDGDEVNITIQDGIYASGEDIKHSTDTILEAIGNIELDGDWAKYTQAEEILTILDAFVAAYTVARAGKLDNLDALISSRAPANTALNNGVWTDARAGKLDNLDGKISSRAPASTALSNATWTNARAGYIDYLANATYGLQAIKNYIDTLETVIGMTTNTGGTTSAGTAMAKLNAILGKVGTVGDFAGKEYRLEYINHTDKVADGSVLKSFTHAKGGLAKFSFNKINTGYTYTLKVDGVQKFNNLSAKEIVSSDSSGGESHGYIMFPFSNSFEITMPKTAYGFSCRIEYYLNK